MGLDLLPCRGRGTQLYPRNEDGGKATKEGAGRRVQTVPGRVLPGNDQGFDFEKHTLTEVWQI